MTLRTTFAAMWSVLALALLPPMLGDHWDGADCKRIEQPSQPAEVTP